MFTCPFCDEKDFDLWGLQYHLQNYCEVFGSVDEQNDIGSYRKPESAELGCGATDET